MKRVAASAVKQALADSTLLLLTNRENKSVFVSGDQWHDIYDLAAIEDAVKGVGRTSYELFRIKSDRSLKEWELDSIGVGKNLLICLCKYDLIRIRQEYPVHEFNPYIREFFAMVDGFKYRDELLDFAYLSDQEKIIVTEALNASCAVLRTAVTSKAFLTRLQKCQRTTNKNYQGLVRYIDRHLETRRRLLVLRVDLGFAKDLCNEMVSGQVVDWNELKVCLKRLIRTLSEHVLVDSWRGFAYKIEYGLQKGLHVHLLVLLDGDLVRQDVTIAKMIGELWKAKITGGKGTYFNCNAIKNSYRACGIGMVSYDDNTTRQNLYYAAMYLTKTDYYIAFAALGANRTFGRGNMPRVVTKRMGRPRKGAVEGTMQTKGLTCVVENIGS